MIKENRWVATICLGICTVFTSLNWMYMRFPQYYQRFFFGMDAAIWLMSSYIIAEVAMVILAGVLVDRIGSKNTTLIGVTLFVAGSFGVCLSDTFEFLLMYRIIQGLGAGFIFTVGVCFVPLVFDKTDRKHPHKVTTLAFSVGSIFGTATGRYFLIDLHDWKLFILISAISVLVLGLIAYISLTNHKRETIHDLPGLILTVTTIASIMCYTQTVNQQFKLLSFESFAFLEFCLIQAFLLIYVEKKSTHPILFQGIKRTHIGLFAGMFMAGFCGLGMLQFLTMFIIAYYKISLFNATCMILIMIAGGATTSVIGMELVYKIGIRPMALASPIIIMIGYIGAYFLFSKGIVFVGISMYVIGFGFGLIITEMLLSMQAITPLKEVGAYSATLMSLRFVGIILGMSVYDNFVLGPIRDYIKEVKGLDTVDLLDWITNHMYSSMDGLMRLFEDAVHSCCIVAAITVLSVFIITYFFTGKEDLDAPERFE